MSLQTLELCDERFLHHKLVCTNPDCNHWNHSALFSNKAFLASRSVASDRTLTKDRDM